MSEADRREIQELEDEYLEQLLKADKEQTQQRYLNIGAVIGIIFIFTSASFEQEFYRLLGTLGMGILQGAAGLCMLMAIIFLLPGVRAENKYRWKMLEEKRKKIEKLKKDIR